MAFPEEDQLQVPFITLKEAKAVRGVQFQITKLVGISSTHRGLWREEGGSLRGGRAVWGLQDQMAGAGEQGKKGPSPSPGIPRLHPCLPRTRRQKKLALCLSRLTPLSKVLKSGACGCPVGMSPCAQV